MSDTPANVLPFPTVDVGAAVTSILKAIEAPEWAQAVPAQAHTILRTRRYANLMGQAHLDAICQRMARALHFPVERVHFLLSLEREADVRRGLRWRPSEVPFDSTELGYPAADDGWIGNYLAYARESKAHLAFQFWAGLAVLGAAAGRNFYFDNGGSSFIYPNIYVMLEGTTGTGKTTSCKRALDLLKRANLRLQVEYERSNKVGKPPGCRILPQKLTSASFVEELKAAQRARRCTEAEEGFNINETPDDHEVVAMLPAPELATLLGKDTFSPTDLIVALTALFDDDFDESTITRGGTRLRNVALTCLFGSTLVWLRQTMDRAMFGGGFMGSRMLVVSRPRQRVRDYPTAPPMDPVQRERLVDFLTILMQHEPTEMEMTPEARKLYEKWYYDRPDVDPGHVSFGYYERRDVHLQKLSMLLALSNREWPWISEQRVKEAIHHLAVEESYMLPAFASITNHIENEDLDWLWDTIVKLVGERAGATIVRSELMDAVRYRLGSAKRIDELLSMLDYLGVITVGKAQRREAHGRPATVYCLRKLRKTEAAAEAGQMTPSPTSSSDDSTGST